MWTLHLARGHACALGVSVIARAVPGRIPDNCRCSPRCSADEHVLGWIERVRRQPKKRARNVPRATEAVPLGLRELRAGSLLRRDVRRGAPPARRIRSARANAVGSAGGGPRPEAACRRAGAFAY